MIEGVNNAYFDDAKAFCAVTCHDPVALGVVLAAMNDTKAIILSMDASVPDMPSTSCCASTAWRERFRSIGPRFRTIGHRVASRQGACAGGRTVIDAPPYVYGVPMAMAEDFMARNLHDIQIVICHFDSDDMRQAPVVMSAIRASIHKHATDGEVMVVMSMSTTPHAVDGFIASSEHSLQRKLSYGNMSPFLPGPTSSNQLKIMRRTMPDMPAPDRDRTELLGQARSGLGKAYESQLEDMITCAFDSAIREWCRALRAKNTHITIACITYHTRAQRMLEIALHEEHMTDVTVWTVAQVHQSRSTLDQKVAPHLLIFCEPQLNPWDAWFCITGFDASLKMRVAMCFWSYLDVATHALDNDRYNFVTDWSEEHAALARQWNKKHKL